MSCPEYNRLRQHYQEALRHWGHVLFSLDAHLVGTAARKAAEIKQKAFEERNAAKERWTSHTHLPVLQPTATSKPQSVGCLPVPST
jgi:hypothetical protein